jgi:hypothetical protein
MWNPFSWGSTFDMMFKGTKAGARGSGSFIKKMAGYNHKSAADVMREQKFTQYSGSGFSAAPYANTTSTNIPGASKRSSMGYAGAYSRVRAKQGMRTVKGWGKHGARGFGGGLTASITAGTGLAASGAIMADNLGGKFIDPLTMFATTSGMMQRVDAYQDNPNDHSSRAHAALGAITQEGLDTALMMGASSLGPIGAGLALLTSSVGDISGVGANAMLERGIGKMADQLQSDQYGKKRISQNEETMRAASDQMSLITQTGFAGNELINPQSFSARRRGLLGNEAMLMHN